jgi:hypothetical protein
MPISNSDPRAVSEAAFHDARIKGGDAVRSRLNYAYASVIDVYEFTRVPHGYYDRRVMEVGCFRGDQAATLMGFKGEYVGIDISAAAIEHCRLRELPSNFRFEIDDANVLGSIEDKSIDYVFGQGVLHHLDLPRFAKSLAVKLTPNGFARFVEPAQGNALLRLFRKLSPSLRTPDERPFDSTSLAQLAEHFDVKVTYKAFLRPFVPMLLLNARPVVSVCRRLDQWLLRSRRLQPQAWLLQLELRKPSRHIS